MGCRQFFLLKIESETKVTASKEDRKNGSAHEGFTVYGAGLMGNDLAIVSDGGLTFTD